MATLHLTVGLPCSGKTTFARQLAQEINALLLTQDVWHVKLYGNKAGINETEEQHNERGKVLGELIWDVAKYVLQLGGDVIIDCGCWERDTRDDYRNRAKVLGVNFKIHYMDVPHLELYRRLEIRNRTSPEGVFLIPKADMDKYITVFQPPTEDELL